MGSVSISVVINTLNEETYLPYLLRSIKSWTDEIIVVDMCSEDNTVKIAKSFDAVVYMYEKVRFVEPARAYALSKATGDWILMIDADEIIPQPLSKLLIDIAEEGEFDLVRIPRFNYLCGGPMMTAKWGPTQDSPIRFFKRGMLTTSSKIHAGIHPVEGAKIHHIPYRKGYATIHFNYLNFADFISRLNHYTTIQAEQLLQSEKKSGPLRAIYSASREFISRYFYAKGYKEGWRGFYLSLCMAFYRLITHAKVREIKSVGNRERILNNYLGIAEGLVAEHERKD